MERGLMRSWHRQCLKHEWGFLTDTKKILRVCAVTQQSFDQYLLLHTDWQERQHSSTGRGRNGLACMNEVALFGQPVSLMRSSTLKSRVALRQESVVINMDSRRQKNSQRHSRHKEINLQGLEQIVAQAKKKGISVITHKEYYYGKSMERRKAILSESAMKLSSFAALRMISLNYPKRPKK